MFHDCGKYDPETLINTCVPFSPTVFEQTGFSFFSFPVGQSFYSRVLENCENEARFEEVSAFILRLSVCLSHSSMKTTLKLALSSSGGVKAICGF